MIVEADQVGVTLAAKLENSKSFHALTATLKPQREMLFLSFVNLSKGASVLIIETDQAQIVT
jgi:hypothetical protein